MEKFKRIGVLPVLATAQQVNRILISQDSIVVVADLFSESVDFFHRRSPQTAVSQANQLIRNVFRWNLFLQSQVDHASSQITFANAAARPVNDLSRQDAVDGKLLADRQQQEIYAAGIDIGQLGQVSNAHHHFGIRPNFSRLHVS